MKIEIDQSGRVEYTSHRTVIADSLMNAVYMTTSTKKEIQEIYRKAGKPKLFVYEIFALLIALLIKRSFSKTHSYIIDTEYTGKSDLIKKYVLKFCTLLSFNLLHDQISFGKIKEGSISDRTAHTEFKKITNARKITLEEGLGYLLP